MSDYTPTTEDIRAGWEYATAVIGDEGTAQFDRWLAEYKRKVSKRVWEEGHKTAWKRGPSECKCYAYSSSECGCGKYGTGALLSLNDNPYRKEDN